MGKSVTSVDHPNAACKRLVYSKSQQLQKESLSELGHSYAEVTILHALLA